MKILIDSHFIIGHSHLINEDYALCGSEPRPWMIIADGCSSSQNTDIGARLLALAAKEYLITNMSNNTYLDVNALTHFSAIKAAASAQVVGLSTSAIDSTLFMAYVTQEATGSFVNVLLIGDGTIVYVDTLGNLTTVEVEYSHNAPYYASYRIDSHRRDIYQRKTEEVNAVKTVTTNNVSETQSVFEPTIIRLPISQLDTLLIASDGISSLVDNTNGKTLTVTEVCRSLLSFRNTTGAFIKRKLRRASKDWAKNNIFNSDDLSLGTMYFSDREDI